MSPQKAVLHVQKKGPQVISLEVRKVLLERSPRMNVWTTLDRVFYTLNSGGACHAHTVTQSCGVMTTPASPPLAPGMCYHVSFCQETIVDGI